MYFCVEFSFQIKKKLEFFNPNLHSLNNFVKHFTNLKVSKIIF